MTFFDQKVDTYIHYEKVLLEFNIDFTMCIMLIDFDLTPKSNSNNKSVQTYIYIYINTHPTP